MGYVYYNWLLLYSSICLYDIWYKRYTCIRTVHRGSLFLFLAAAISGRRSGPPNYYPVSNLSPWARQILGSDFGILEDRIDPESCRTNIPAILMPCCLVKKQPPFFLGVAKAFLMTGDSRVIYLFFTLLKCGCINTHYYTCVMQEATKTKRSYIDI